MKRKAPMTDGEKLKIATSALERIFAHARDMDMDAHEKCGRISDQAAHALLRLGKPELYMVLNQQLELLLDQADQAPAPEPGP